MRVEIQGLQQGAIEVELQLLPRVGEILQVMYGADAQIKCEIRAVEHFVNQYDNSQKTTLMIRPLFSCE